MLTFRKVELNFSAHVGENLLQVKYLGSTDGSQQCLLAYQRSRRQWLQRVRQSLRVLDGCLNVCFSTYSALYILPDVSN